MKWCKLLISGPFLKLKKNFLILGFKKAVKLLIENGANVNATNNQTGTTALMLAARNGI